jgi:hypothetical protein
MKTIVASTIRQADLAARILMLDRKEWRYASRIEHLNGVFAEDIVIAYPTLGFDSAIAEIYRFALYRCNMAMIEPTTVTT